MKLIRTEDAVDMYCATILHRSSLVIKTLYSGKGHIVTEEDIPVLLSVGKEHLYVWKRKKACSMRMGARADSAGDQP